MPKNSFLDDLFVEGPPLLGYKGIFDNTGFHLESRSFLELDMKKKSPDLSAETTAWEKTPERKEETEFSQRLFPYDSAPTMSRESSMDAKSMETVEITNNPVPKKNAAESAVAARNLLSINAINANQTVLSADTLNKMKKYAMKKRRLDTLGMTNSKCHRSEDIRAKTALYIAQRLVSGSLMV